MGICFILSLYTDSPFCQIWWLILPFNQPSEVQALDPPLHPNFKTKSNIYIFSLSYLRHFCVLQVFLSVLLPTHAFPPCFSVLATVLCLFSDPSPQDLEHFDHLPQEDHLQCSEKNKWTFLYTQVVHIFCLSYLDTFVDYKIFAPFSFLNISLHHIWRFWLWFWFLIEHHFHNY